MKKGFKVFMRRESQISKRKSPFFKERGIAKKKSTFTRKTVECQRERLLF